VAAPDALPKAGSGAFKKLLAQMVSVLDLPRLCLVLEGALDRRSLEEVLRKVTKGGHLRPGGLSRGELVAMVADAFAANTRAAWLAMRALDKSCRKERHIVGSMDEEDLDVRLSSYRALEFRRERARLVYALVRDGRPAHAQAAERILVEAFAAMAESEEAPAEEEADGADEGQLDDKLALYEAAVKEAGEMLHEAKGERDAAERERGELLAKLGARERQVKEEQKLRHVAEEEVHRLRAETRQLREQLDKLDPELLEDALAERDRLREKARALERQAERAERISELEEHISELEAEVAELRIEADRGRQEQEQLLRQLVSRERAALDRVTSLRGALKTARRLASAPADPSLAEGDPVAERVGVFVDAENISASARRQHGRFDFGAALQTLVSGRKRVMAVAFAVEPDGDDGQFAGFVRALQGAGYEVRTKKVRKRKDGSRKADWDMAMAMEIVSARNRLDVVVLCSGDGDFTPLVQRMKRWGKRVEVASFKDALHDDLERAADEFVELDGLFKH
jgi:uncharacterized LabA/DUF88 family protein